MANFDLFENIFTSPDESDDGSVYSEPEFAEEMSLALGQSFGDESEHFNEVDSELEEDEQKGFFSVIVY
jgi:hypothetical protein